MNRYATLVWLLGGLGVIGFTWAPFQVAVAVGITAGLLIGLALLVETAFRH